MFLSKGEKGKTLISLATESFDTITEQLKEGIEHCEAQKDEHQSKINDHQTNINLLDNHVVKAKRVMQKIEQLVS